MHTKVEQFNQENNKKYIEFLNKQLKIGIDIKNEEECNSFIVAITSSTFAKMYRDKYKKEIQNYEINEFKGDAIITYFVVTEFIKETTVGKMDLRKQSLVSNERLSKIFDDIKIEEFIYYQKNSKELTIPQKVKADIIEALVYAIHKKSPTKAVKFLEKYLEEKGILNDLKNS